MTTTAQLLTQNNGRVAALQASSNSTADTVPIASGGGKLDSWISDATTASPGKVTLATNGGTTPGTAVQASDTRLTGVPANSGTTALTSYCSAGDSGNVTFDGTSAVTGFSGPSGRIYTASTAAVWAYKTLTFDTTGGNIEVITKGDVIKAQSCQIVGSGTVILSWDGSAAVTSTGGAGASALSGARLLGGGNGANGRNSNGVGNNAAAMSSGVCMGGVGGAGSAGINAGGNGGSHTRDWAVGSRYGDAASLLLSLVATDMGASTPTYYGLAGGSGGGGGGASGLSYSGGAGGGAGCVVFCCANLNCGTGTMILRAKGGAGGGTPSAGGNTVQGTGGGGAGGFVGAVIAYLTGVLQLDASGGIGGSGAYAGTATGANGSNGGDGGVAICLYGGLASGTSAPTTSVAGGNPGAGVGTGSNGTAGATGLSLVQPA